MRCHVWFLMMASLGLVACGRNAAVQVTSTVAPADSPTATATHVPPAVQVVDIVPEDGLFEPPENTRYYVANADGLHMFGIQDSIPGERISQPVWEGDSRLDFTLDSVEYIASLPDGRVYSAPPGRWTPAPTYCPRCAGEPDVSPDGLWVVTQEPSDRTDWGDLVVRSADGRAAFRLKGAVGPAWSPDGRLLAFTGDICLTFDVYVFDPVSGRLTDLTASGGQWGFLWSPDGKSIAVDVLSVAEQQSHLDLVDVASNTSRTLAKVNEWGGIQPLAWSPTGMRLLFAHGQGGKGRCEGLGGPGFPTPRKTELELIAE